MVEENVSKADLQALMDTFKSQLEVQESKAQERETSLKSSFQKELEVQANKIHSSYAKKLKKLNLEPSDETPDDETTSEDGVVRRRPTKHELELQASVEKLVKRAEDGEKRARLANLRSDFTDHAVKNGVNPEAVDTIFTVMQAKGAFQDDGEELGFKLKVNVDGAQVALPLDSAFKHYVKSPEAKFFLAPKGAAGSGSTQPNQTKATDGKPKPRVEVDWAAIGSAIVNGSE